MAERARPHAALTDPLDTRILRTNPGRKPPILPSYARWPCLSSLDVDTRSDVYALGVLLYELLTGTTPFDNETLKKAGYDEMRRIIREDEPAKPSARLSTLHQEALSTIAEQRGLEPRKLGQQMRGELDWIVMRALEKDRNRRYESASAFAADVQRYLGDEPVQACPPSTVYRLGKYLRRHRTGVLTAAAMLVAAVALAGSLGWMARDQAVRQAIIKGEVQRSLKEVQRLQEQGRWAQALEIARQTQTLLETSATDEVIQQQVRERFNDLRMMLRLEEIRLNLRMLRGGSMLELERVNNEYAKVFQEYGVDVDKLRPEEAAAIIQAKSVRLELAMALDIWARMRRGLKNNDHGWKHLNDLARAADPDEWRNQFRQVWESGDEKEIGVPLENLVASAKVDDLLPETIVLLAEALAMADRGDQAVAFLRTAQRRHSGNFWINQALASWLADSTPPRYDEAIRYYFASFASRPDYAISRVDLGYAFFHKGEVDEAMTYFDEAIRLKPDYWAAYRGLENILRDQKYLSGAVARYQKAIELNPKNAAAYIILGFALYEQKDVSGAVARYQKAIELNPKNAAAYIYLGAVLCEQKDLIGAIDACKKAIELNPKDATPYNFLGFALFKQKDLAGAIAHFQKAIELDPEYASAYVNLGDALCEQKDLIGAIDACKKAIELNPKDATPYNFLGFALFKQKDLAGAIAHFQKAIELNPKYTTAFNNLGVALHEQKDLTGAVAAWRKAIELNPKNTTAFKNLGVALREQKDLTGAVAAWRKAIELDPKNAGGYNNLGVALCEQKDLTGAVAAWRKAIELDPKNAGGYIYLGAVLCEQKDLIGAIDACKKAIELNPKDATPYNFLGVALREQKDLTGAVAAWRKAIELDPKNAGGYNNLGVALCEQQDLTGAVAALRKAIEIEPKNIRSYTYLGRVLYVYQKPPQAEAVLRQAIFSNSKDSDAYHNLSNVLYLQQRLLEAEEAARMAIELSPKYANAYNTLGIIFRAQQKLLEADDAQSKAMELNAKSALGNMAWLLMAQGRFEEALVAFKRTEKFDSVDICWAERWLELDAKLSRILTGETLPADAAELLALAEFSQLHCRQYYAASVRFYREAFAADPKLVGELRADIRYNAACAAAQAACGKGKEAGNLEPQEYARLRGQALEWLRADLKAWGLELAKEPDTAKAGVLYEMDQWKKDAALEGVRAPDALAKLPEAERQAWQTLWEEVAELERRAAVAK